jgi:hypothetical protein
VDVDSTCRVFHRDVPAVTGPVPLQLGAMLRKDKDGLIRYNYPKIVVVGTFMCGTRPRQAKRSEAKGS